MKVKNDHRSKFSNLSNWKEETWKKWGLQRDSNPWPPRCRCDALPTELWSHTLKLYQASLNIAERELGENPRWKIYVMVQMAYWHHQNGNMVKAKALKDQAMKMSDALKLPDHQPPNRFLLKKIWDSDRVMCELEDDMFNCLPDLVSLVNHSISLIK